MLKVTSFFKKIVLMALATALGLAALPVKYVHASGLGDPPFPPGEERQLSEERLERIWERIQRTYERQGRILDRADEMNDRLQDLLDRMSENGKDVTALQAALDDFDDVLEVAHPIYESAKGIINSHKGFDADGRVTEAEKARETVMELGEKLREVRLLTGEPGKALREAFKAFREANRPEEPSVP